MATVRSCSSAGIRGPGLVERYRESATTAAAIAATAVDLIGPAIKHCFATAEAGATAAEIHLNYSVAAAPRY